eukprot:scaffold9751_cov34-Tisochrysis_lutea.AAC.2
MGGRCHRTQLGGIWHTQAYAHTCRGKGQRPSRLRRRCCCTGLHFEFPRVPQLASGILCTAL